MRILIFLSHPAQFLFYRNPVIRLREKGHTVFILIKTKDILSDLLDEQGWTYFNILPTERGKSKISILRSLISRDISIYKFVRKNKIQLLAGSDASLAHVGKMLGIDVITTLEDDYEVIRHLAKLTYPFTTRILVPDICHVGKWTKKKIGYSGYMKLSYLHPNVFTPDKSVLHISEDQPYFIIRLSKLGAHHDFGEKGISGEFLDKIISLLETHGKVYISSENELPEKYGSLRLNIPASAIHHYLCYAQMLICDSQSMAVEAAVLGTPSIRISSFSGRISVLEELEHKYKLTFGIKAEDENKALKTISELLSLNNLKSIFHQRRDIMLYDKIDVSAFVLWLINNYPSSIKTLNENPDFQFSFK